jgi:single-stranded-DNA-specific exonuclease
MLHHPLKQAIVRASKGPLHTLGSLPPLLRRIYAHRGIGAPNELDLSLGQLPDPQLLSGMATMTEILVDAILSDQRILVIGDYDADGATATAVALLGLQSLGLRHIDYLVPNRFEYGYGLTPEIVSLAMERSPDILLTVDNGISSHEGVAAARRAGIKVLITDHHLPGEALPAADAIVNPNLAGDPFPSKALSGVGVLFYVLLGLRQTLRAKGYFEGAGRAEPQLGQLLDFVALGTVADVVTLDQTNRILIRQGLRRIQCDQAHPGIRALIAVAGKKASELSAQDLGFTLGPRLNAAGRLDDMALGIECLIASSEESARPMAEALSSLNQERRVIEQHMRDEAFQQMDRLTLLDEDQPVLCLFEESWHQGVVGIVASRIKDRTHRPVIAFAVNELNPSELKGSARSVPGVHIRDVLADVATRHPGLITRYGGHAMAAGLSLPHAELARFTAAVIEEMRRRGDDQVTAIALHSDGALPTDQISLPTAELLFEAGPWGQGFPEPLFDGEFEVLDQRIVGERHLKLTLRPEGGGASVDAIAFNVENPGAWLRTRMLKMAYRLDINRFRGRKTVQLRIEYMESRGA